MSTTLEVRWFKSSPLPDAVQEWFENLDPDAASTWTDVYLPSEDAGYNVKVREDMLQIKRRRTEPVSHTFAPPVTGRYEQWKKWSFDLAEQAPDPSTDTDAEMWIPIEKTRRQRTYDPEWQAKLGRGLPTSPTTTVLIELTTLTTPRETAWTLCLEAEGPPSRLSEPLLAAGDTLFDTDFPLSLTADESFGYVRWLQQLPSVRKGALSETWGSPEG